MSFPTGSEEWYIYKNINDNYLSKNVREIKKIDSIDCNEEIEKAKEELHFLENHYNIQDSSLITYIVPAFYIYKKELERLISESDTTRYNVYEVAFYEEGCLIKTFAKIDRLHNVTYPYLQQTPSLTLEDIQKGDFRQKIYDIKDLSHDQLTEKANEVRIRREREKIEREKKELLQAQKRKEEAVLHAKRAEEQRQTAIKAMRNDDEFVRGYNIGYSDGHTDREYGEPYLSGHDYNGIVKRGQIIHKRDYYCSGYDEGYEDGYRGRRQKITF